MNDRHRKLVCLRRERMELLHLRELLSCVAHFAEHPALCELIVPRVHALVVTYG